MQWQPIETAPKDGNPILIWVTEKARPVVGDYIIAFWWEDCWVHSETAGSGRLRGRYDFTHWMPLPEAP